MKSQGLGHAAGLPAEAQLVSLLACFEELLIECLGARSTFISGQCECIAGGEFLKVPAEAAKAWIRAMLSTSDQLQSLDLNTLAQYVDCDSSSPLVWGAIVAPRCAAHASAFGDVGDIWPQSRLTRHPRSYSEQSGAAGIRFLPGQPPGEGALPCYGRAPVQH